MGANLQLTFPQGEYQSNFPKTGVGLRVNIMHRLKDDGPLSLGGEIGFLVTGSDSRLFDMYYGGYYDTYKVSASNNVFSLAFKARADLVDRERPLQLFLVGTVGTNLFYSAVSVERQSYFGGSQYVGGDNSKGYWAFTWGPGIGLEFPIDKRKQAALSFTTSYLLGANTTYLTDPYVDGNGDVYFNRHESKTDMILLELGVRFSLSKKRRR